MDEILSLIESIFSEGSLIKMVLGNPRKKSLPYKKAVLRPVMIKDVPMFQAEYHYEKKVFTENYDREAAISLICELITEDFKNIDIFTENNDFQILASKPDNPRIVKRAATKDASCRREEHDRQKNRIIPEGKPCAFLTRLGVMDAEGNVYKKYYSKYRQINRYLEILSDVEDHLPKDLIRVIDFGCGKAYLTFAIYYYLHEIKGRKVDIIGLDLKDDVIDFCNSVAADLGYDRLNFMKGDIADFTADGADMVVTLHACDTATDYSLINAVRWNAQVILSVPCCQHELFRQIEDEVEDPILKHGIIKDKFTELLTDGLRGLKLEEAGYKVQMTEFTTLEHTSKNIMIKAVKTGLRGDKRSRKAVREYEALVQRYKVSPTIDRL
ncbi:MAG: SAM-dependent methyltransferase [Eubacteriaceae bacterium]|jgi:SAM-dependent methyltransferase|nr:SAM-dependent methyltransferase [Eubacteriaceae bacterium]